MLRRGARSPKGGEELGCAPSPKTQPVGGGGPPKHVREGGGERVLQAASKFMASGSPGFTAQHGTVQVTPKSLNFTQPLPQEPPAPRIMGRGRVLAAPKPFTPAGVLKQRGLGGRSEAPAGPWAGS